MFRPRFDAFVAVARDTKVFLLGPWLGSIRIYKYMRWRTMGSTLVLDREERLCLTLVGGARGESSSHPDCRVRIMLEDDLGYFFQLEKKRPSRRGRKMRRPRCKSSLHPG